GVSTIRSTTNAAMISLTVTRRSPPSRGALVDQPGGTQQRRVVHVGPAVPAAPDVVQERRFRRDAVPLCEVSLRLRPDPGAVGADGQRYHRRPARVQGVLVEAE